MKNNYTNILLNVCDNINSNLDFLNMILADHQNYYKEILLIFKKLIEQVITKNDSNSEVNIAIMNLNKINVNISKIQALIEDLINIKTCLSTENNNNNIKLTIENYNTKYTNDLKEIFQNSKEIQKYITNTLNQRIIKNGFIYNTNLDNASGSTNDNNFEDYTETIKKEINHIKDTQNIDYNFKEKTLIISDSKITLPYTINELTEIYNRNSEIYSSLYEVILRNYTLPASYFKNSPLSRFKEAYKLAINSGKRKSTAIKLGIELFGNFNLHPAIIKACKDTNELDIYLSCLEYDELDDFTGFKILYDLKPTVAPKGKRFSYES